MSGEERRVAETKVEQLQADVKLWKARVNEAANALAEFEVIQAENRTLQAENSELRKCHEAELGVCEQHCDVVAELKAKNKQLLEALQALYDAQNGPPLMLQRKKDIWDQAMKLAEKALFGKE